MASMIPGAQETAAERPATVGGMLALAPAGAIALTFEHQTLTYTQLREQVARMAGGLHKKRRTGITKPIEDEAARIRKKYGNND